jgi:hypothetical protein
LHLLGTKITRSLFNNSLGVLNARVHACNFLVKAAKLVSLVVAFNNLALVELLKASDLAPHLSALDLHRLNFTFKVGLLLAKVSDLVTLGYSLIAETASFEVFLVENFLAARFFFVEVHVLAGLFLKQVFEIIELLAGISDFIRGSVQAVAVFVFGSCLIIAEHAVAVFHGKDFVIDSTVVAVLVAEIVELLSELSNKLVFFG